MEVPMQRSNRLIVSMLVTAGLFLGCQKPHGGHDTEHPVEVKQIDGSELSHVILTEKSIQRLDVKTDQVRETNVARSASSRKVVPYSALIYDSHGQPWVYTSSQPRTFVRHKVEIDYIEGNLAVLNAGPPTGTIIATVAVAELYGAEFKVGH
jgi:hypothetical protein